VDELIRSLEQAVAAQPDARALRLHLARLLLDDGQAAAALGHCQTILRAGPTDAEATALAREAASAIGLTPGPEAAPAQVAASEVTTPDQPVAPSVPTDAELEDIVRPSVTLDDVAGMQAVKERIRVSFLEPMRNPAMREMYGASMRGGLLLYGPPGCGKTFLAKALAGELGLMFVSAGLSELLDMYVGNSEKQVHRLFERARQEAPAVLFLDEVDAIGHRRSRAGMGVMRGVVNQLLMELDGVQSSNEGVLVLAATNQPWDVDPALRRPGRLDRQLLVVPPDLPAREHLVRLAMPDRPVQGVDAASVAASTDGFSGADLVHLCDSATALAMSDSVRTGVPRPVAQDDFDRALRDVRPSTAAWFDEARPHVQFGNDSGAYDELAAYLDQARTTGTSSRWRRR
jgi:SpoVK/Ycf46/Vps4 family AAA+-type ATPase